MLFFYKIYYTQEWLFLQNKVIIQTQSLYNINFVQSIVLNTLASYVQLFTFHSYLVVP